MGEPAPTGDGRWGMEHGQSGMGRWAIGHGAWAIGHWAWDMAKLAVAGGRSPWVAPPLDYRTLLYINFKYWPVAITYLTVQAIHVFRKMTGG